VDTGVEPSVGTSGIAGPGCLCWCEETKKAQPESLILSPTVPLAESGYLVKQDFIDLPGEPNCHYLWKLHVAWIGQGQGFIFARDRCIVQHIDKRSRDTEGDSLPTDEFDHRLMVCGPTTLCVQMRNSVENGIVHSGSVTVSAELMECIVEHNLECCCGPYPACACDPAVAPEIICRAQREGIPEGWSVDEDYGTIVNGDKTGDSMLTGLAYTVNGDVSCAYKVRIELDIDAGLSCLPVFMGDDYASVCVGPDGRGQLYADVWVCGGTVFTLLMTGPGGKAKFRVTYGDECRMQTPVCCP
jgi:hypothetical protein